MIYHTHRNEDKKWQTQCHKQCRPEENRMTSLNTEREKTFPCQSRNLYPAKISFINGPEIKTFSNIFKRGVGETGDTSRPVAQEILKEYLGKKKMILDRKSRPRQKNETH